MNLFNRTNSRKVQFGISPFGIWANRSTTAWGSLTRGKECYTTIYADVRRWVKGGYVDYVIPQIYWEFAHSAAPYAPLVDWWCNVVQNTSVKLYIGMAPYRVSGGSWQGRELVNQLRYNRMKNAVSGAAFFSYRHLFGRESTPQSRMILQKLR